MLAARGLKSLSRQDPKMIDQHLLIASVEMFVNAELQTPADI